MRASATNLDQLTPWVQRYAIIAELISYESILRRKHMAEIDTDQLQRSRVHKGLGMSVVEYKPGFVILSMPLSEEVRRGYEGTIHGGILATFADAACASCLVGCYDRPGF